MPVVCIALCFFSVAWTDQTGDAEVNGSTHFLSSESAKLDPASTVQKIHLRSLATYTTASIGWTRMVLGE